MGSTVEMFRTGRKEGSRRANYPIPTRGGTEWTYRTPGSANEEFKLPARLARPPGMGYR